MLRVANSLQGKAEKAPAASTELCRGVPPALWTRSACGSDGAVLFPVCIVQTGGSCHSKQPNLEVLI